MYRFRVLPQRPALVPSPLELPIGVLQARPRYVTNDPKAPSYDLRMVIEQLLKNLIDHKRRSKVMKVEVWPPALCEKGFDFRGSGKLANRRRKNYPQYEIVHFVGRIKRSRADAALVLDRREKIGTKTLRVALTAAGTRLLILHVPTLQFLEAYQLAEMLILQGGPAVLVAAGTQFKKGEDSDWGHKLDDYWHGFYLNILHNYSLPSAADPKSMSGVIARSVKASLICRAGAEKSLQLDQWMNKLETRLKNAFKQAAEQRESLKEVHAMAREVLHRSHIEEILSSIDSADKEIDKILIDIEQRRKSLSEVERQMRYSESLGVGPLSEIGEGLPQLESAASRRSRRMVKKVDRATTEAAKQAPRVLNANFADPYGRDQMLPSDKGLLAGAECELLVDVGPRWDKDESIVTGVADFPTKALPPGVRGWVVQVVLVSADFKPGISSAMIWVARKGGRSFPYHDGKHATRPGPVALHLRTPDFREDQSQPCFTAFGRLCLYYEGNLLQSAMVKVAVVRTPDVALSEKNEIAVDYVLTGSFQKIERFGERAISFGKRSGRKAHPVALNLTLNDDGSGSHRIIIKPRTDASADTPTATTPSATEFPPAAWTKYDPAASAEALNQARKELHNCFFVRDKEGKPDENKGALTRNHGKSREQFKRDLWELALVGNTLFNMVTTDIMAEGDETAAKKVTRAITQALADPAIIQVARTGPASYVFPWALIYDIPLPGPSTKFRYCDVLSEWDEQGIRQSSRAIGRCPFEDENWHMDNAICPYGFWGLKHMIEQPLSALIKREVDQGNRKKETWVFGEAVSIIQTGSRIKLAVGTTEKLDRMVLENHLKEIKRIFQVTEPPATDVDKLLKLLPTASFVYIACHGKYNEKSGLPYLNIGPSDDSPIYRIFPNSVRGWADTKKTPNLDAWETQHPLVFINGCHTADLTPGQLLEFVSSFRHAQAGGVVGTEISLQAPFAFEVAEQFFRLLGRKAAATVGEAMYRIRWELANKGNLLGLAYTPYCLADLHFTFQQ